MIPWRVPVRDRLDILIPSLYLFPIDVPPKVFNVGIFAVDSIVGDIDVRMKRQAE